MEINDRKNNEKYIEKVSDPLNSPGNRYMFTGREYESGSGLYYYRARFYHPSIGRFIQPDPIRYADGMNIYAYVKNNSVNLIDPSGKNCVDQCLTLGFMGMAYGVVSGECGYICRGVCKDECGSVTLTGPYFKIVPVHIFGLGYCPFYAIIIDDKING